MEKLRAAILEQLKLDEYEYCFDRTYCDDELWVQDNGSETREQAYERVVTYWESIRKNSFIAEIREHFGDKYDDIIQSNDYKLEVERR